MAMIDVVNLSFSYDGSSEEVFRDVSFRIDTDWKLGFVGRNGRGKTTFLNLLLGKYSYQGHIAASTDFVYFPYDVRDKDRMTYEILSEINPQSEDWQLFRELNLLNVDVEVLYRPFSTLSYGEQEKVLLAALFLGEDRFLLIDEPTNHLDAEARQQIAQYLNRKKGFILVSHDRNFLDSCVDHILSINRMNIEVQKGNFSSWYANKEAADRMEEAQNQKLTSEVKRLKQAARQSSGWSDQVEKSKKGQRVAGLRPDRGHIGHKAAKMMKRAKILENRQQQAVEEKSKLLKNIDTMDVLELRPLLYHTDRMAELKDVSIFYGGRRACSGVTFDIRRGERVCLAGRNGCGKSSILKLLLGEDLAFEGNVHIGSGLRISYISQDTSFLKGDLRELAREYGLEESLFKAVLRKLDLQREQFEKDVSLLSAGQKKKVLLAKSLCEQAHLYVWDEPLNYIDVLSRVQIEELLLRCRPTILFVEHDMAFRKNVATKVIEMHV